MLWRSTPDVEYRSAGVGSCRGRGPMEALMLLRLLLLLLGLGGEEESFGEKGEMTES
jgi:hypothetical protein